MSKQLEIRGTKKQWFFGKLAACVVGLLGWTLRYRVDDPHSVKDLLRSSLSDEKDSNASKNASKEAPDAGVWVFWHAHLLSAPLALTRFIGKVPASTLTSASKDGAIIASFLSSFGVKSVRGSSSRRAVAALIALKRALKQGDQVFVTPDGPRGPRYHMEGGVVKLAQSVGCPLFPVRFVYSSSWRLGTWDHLRIPKPFSSITLELGRPVMVPAKLNENDFEILRKKVEATLREGVDDFPQSFSEKSKKITKSNKNEQDH